MELPSPELDVPKRAAAQASAERAAARTETVRTREQDIEFETVTRVTREHTLAEESADLRQIRDLLDRQQREIDRVRDNQEKLAARNVPREILKRLDESIRMERLRGGR